MFGFGFESRVRSLLSSHFGYSPDANPGAVFSATVRDLRKGGYNEYDAASIYMLTVMNVLSPSEESTAFVRRHTEGMTALLPRCSRGGEIAVLLAQAREAHGTTATRAA